MTQTMQSMRNKIILIFSFTAFLTVLSFAAVAQEVVRGKITDKEKKPLQGVSVSEMDADNRIVKGTQTDIEGNFVLKNVNQLHNV
jgi:hypothetical protein